MAQEVRIMSSLKTLNSEADLETLNVHREMFTLNALTSEVDKREAIIPQQRFEQEMEDIWEKVNQLPEGQDKVVLSQIWECGKTTPSPTPKNFPALATYGFIAEQLVEDQFVWGPSTPYLKDFWRIGIHVSNANGYILQPRHVFHANLQAHTQMIFSKAFQDGAHKLT
jgi:hypothetical protein